MGTTRQVVKQDTPRLYGDAVINNNLAIKYKDAGGTARSVLSLGSDNLTRVGPQAAPSSAGDLLFYANGAETGRFTPAGSLTLGTAGAATALTISGTHSTAAATIASGSGPLIVGGTSALFSSSAFEVQSSAGADPFITMGTNSANHGLNMVVKNSSGSIQFGVAGGTNSFITGSFAGDGLVMARVAGKRVLFGGTVAVLAVGQDNTLQFLNGTTVLGSMTTAGLFTFTSLKMTTSPVSGYVLTSDASGNATWQSPAPFVTTLKWGTD